jgi:hypothetical protein
MTKKLELEDEVVDVLLVVLRKMAHAGRSLAKHMMSENLPLNEENLSMLAQAAMVDSVYAEVKKANKRFEIAELENILALNFETENAEKTE